MFTSTVAGGGYGGERFGELFVPIARELLRAAYLGTLLSAVSAGRRAVVLTLIGGGVFGNPIPEIWDAIGWAMAEVEGVLSGDLDVFVNGRDLGRRLPQRVILEGVERRGGAMIAFDRESRASIVRGGVGASA
ncbi:MAG: hypothetical protein R3B70_31220 [Polyangiaceae bacterium]